MLLLFIWCAYTAPFLRFINTDYILSTLLYLSIFAIYYKSYCLRFRTKPLSYILFAFSVWYVVICVKYSAIVNVDFGLVYSVLLCHVAFCLYKEKEFFIYFEKVLVHLTLISLVVWGLGLIAIQPMRALFDIIALWKPEPGGTLYGNIIFVSLGNRYSMGIFRNPGFTWEAGRFACFLVIGLFVSLLLHNMEIKKNKSFWIFLVGLISTVSTTGVGACVGVALLYFSNKGNSQKMLCMVLSILLLPFIWSLEFVSGKIFDNIDLETEIYNMGYSFSRLGTESICPQRFTGLFLEFQNWIHDFWIGYGQKDFSYTQAELFHGYDVWLSNGLIMIFAKYGTLVGVGFYYCLFKSSSKIVHDFGYKGSFLFVLTFMLISMSYDFWSNGVFLYFVLYWLYCKYRPQCSINYTTKVLLKYYGLIRMFQFAKRR